MIISRQEDAAYLNYNCAENFDGDQQSNHSQSHTTLLRSRKAQIRTQAKLKEEEEEEHNNKTQKTKNKNKKNNKKPSQVQKRLLLFVGCLTSQQHASVSQGRICSDNFTCCHTEIEVADQMFYLTQSQYTDTGPTSPSADPISPGAWQGSHWSANF